MSRNLCSSTCHGPVTVEEKPRPITRAEAGPYYDEYRSLPFANAHCPVCGAKYLAWFSRWNGFSFVPDDEVRDLSYRRAFNDEPHPDDEPTHIVRETRILERRPVDGGEWIECSRTTGGAS